MRASVVIPTYNRPGKLQRTVDSVLSQDVDDYEVLVVDDGSNDPEQSAVLNSLNSEPRITVVEQENAGPAAARNNGWRQADGDIVLFTDDDCLVPTDWVSTLLEGFDHENIAAVGGPLVPTEEKFHERTLARFERLRAERTYRPIESTQIGDETVPFGITANIAYRRTVLEEVDGFDETIPVASGEDHDLMTRIGERRYKFKYVPTAVRHNDDYDLGSFLERSIRRGAGTHHYNRRHGPARGVDRILLGLAAAPLFLPRELVRYGDPRIACLSTVERMLNRYGELREHLRDR